MFSFNSKWSYKFTVWEFQWPHHCQHILLSVFLILVILVDVYSDISSGFYLYFFNSKRCWIFFQLFMGHLCIFFWKKSVQIFCSFKNWVIILIVVLCTRMTVLGIRIFHSCLWFAFSFKKQMVSFEEEKF